MVKKLWLIATGVVFVVFLGCATADKIGRAITTGVIEETEEMVKEETNKINNTLSKIKEKVTVKKYIVVKGDCLWKIAENQYGDPFLWPAIYKDNKYQIENPDIIDINQKLEIRYNHTNNEWNKCRKEAYIYGE